MRLSLIFFIVLLLVSRISHAEVEINDFERGLAAIEMGNAQRAHELWLPLAEKGNPNAQFGLSMMFMDGIGVEQDFDEAVFWLFKAADQGFPPAQFHLGNVYERGIGRYPDVKRAIYWWTMAADQGLGAAQYRLGKIYWDGAGVPVDKAKARKYLLQAQASGEFIASDYRAALEQPPEAAPPVTPPRAAPTTSCAQWLSRQPDQGYTLQMIAAQKQTSIRYFIEQHNLTETYAVCAYRERGKDWFGLFYGVYPNKASASAAIDRLPATLQSNQPYLRRFSSLKKLTQFTPAAP